MKDHHIRTRHHTPVISALAALGVVTTLAAVPESVLAQGASDYPNKPVVIIVPFEGNGIRDDMRVFQQHMNMGGAIGNFVFESKAGASGSIGASYVARAKPDGYTLLATNTTFTIAPAINPELPYDPVKDLVPVTLLMQKAYLLLVNADTPFKTVKEYVDYARANPDKLNFSTGGLGGSTHLPGAMLHYMTGTKVTFVHYKSAAQRLIDLVGGRVQAAVGTYATTLPQVKAGKMRAIGVTTSRRVSNAPDLPSIGETVPGFEYSSWTGVLAPAKTPPAIVNRINQLWVDAIRAPASAKKLETEGTLIVANSPEEFGKFIAADFARWRKLAQDTGIKPGND